VPDEHLFNESTSSTGEIKPSSSASHKKRSTKKAAKGSRKSSVTFEEKYARLEAIIAEIERPDLPLEELIARFEEGVQLVRECARFLQDAKLRVEQHIEEKDGTYTLKELPAGNSES